MATEYEWIIHTINVKKDVDGMKDVIVNVYWELKATDGSNVSDSHYQTTDFPLPDPNSFVEYADLQKADVVAWIESWLQTQKRYESIIDENGYSAISQENESQRIKRVLAENLVRKATIVQKVVPWS